MDPPKHSDWLNIRIFSSVNLTKKNVTCGMINAVVQKKQCYSDVKITR